MVSLYPDIPSKGNFGVIWTLMLVFISSFILTGAVRVYALRRDLVDYPNARSSHSSATPRGGGLAIVITYSAAVSSFYFHGILSLYHLLAFILAGGGVAAIGYWDDHGHIPAGWRIIVHFLAVAMAMYWLNGSFSLQLGSTSFELGWFGYLTAVVFFVWLLNLFNFMDGIDGIASVEAINITGSASVISLYAGQIDKAEMPVISLQLALLAAVSGFLLWNWPPAKIFLGDVGSGFLGFIVSVLAYINVDSDLLSIWSWLILVGVFLVDATITLIRRFLRGARWYQAHRDHAYQHAARLWKSHGIVSGAVVVINVVWLLPFAWFASIYPEKGWYLTCIAFLPLILLAFRLRAGLDDEAASR